MHWDISLDNLFCCGPCNELQPGNRVKLLDFGVHKVLAGKLYLGSAVFFAPRILQFQET